MAVFIRRITWGDVAGGIRTTAITANASAAAIQAALLNISNADYLTESEGQLFTNSTPTPLTATYQSVADAANLLYADSTGSIVQLTLPAPRAAIFLADGSTVDPANSDIIALNATVVGVVLTPAGNPVANFVGGVRVHSS